MNKQIIINYEEFDSLESSEYIKLLRLAKESMYNAYAPYSEYKVGAAVLLNNGHIELGSNQENMAFSPTICAERVAIFAASVKYPDVPIKTIVITSHSDKYVDGNPTGPCGVCRQVMSEIEMRHGQKIKIILQKNNKTLVFNGIENLLPFSFEGLKNKI